MGRETIKINLRDSIRKENSLKRIIRERILPSPQNRYFNWGRNMKLSKCIGLVGPRGSCKSLSAAAIGIIDYMVPGYELVSNMAVKWAVTLGDYIVGYASSDLDKAEFLNFEIKHKAAVLIDEVNLEFSEARRSTTNRNLIFNKILQQLRKRNLNLIYTAQHEMWVDNRLRWQTDLFIKCQDVCLMPGGLSLPFDFGEMANWRIYDMSGIFGQGAYQDTGRPLIEQCQFKGRQWWNTYDTSQLQAEDETTYGKPSYGEVQLARDKKIVAMEEDTDYLRETIQGLHDQGVMRIESALLYDMLGIKTHSGKMYVGKLLKQLTVKYEPWTKSYIIPDADLEKPETMKKRLEVIYKD